MLVMVLRSYLRAGAACQVVRHAGSQARLLQQAGDVAIVGLQRQLQLALGLQQRGWHTAQDSWS